MTACEEPIMNRPGKIGARGLHGIAEALRERRSGGRQEHASPRASASGDEAGKDGL